MKIFIAEIALLASLVLGIGKGSGTLLTEDCGTTKHPSRIRRIVGGVDADRFANPWMVMVVGENNYFCGGSLITRLFVLTSASCLLSSLKQVILGEYDTSCTTENCMSSRQVIDIDQRFIHSQFSNKSESAYDIALLRLAKKALISDYIRPICLSVDRQVGHSALSLTATGWGRTFFKDTSSILQQVTLHKFDKSYCEDMSTTNLHASQLCVGSLERDTCAGDSGGPLSVKLNLDGEGHWSEQSRAFLLGIVSYGPSSCAGLGVYTNVEHFTDWIVRTINASNKLSSQAINT